VVLKWHLTGKKNTDNSVLHNISGQIYDDPRTGSTSAVFPFPAFEQLRKSSGALSVVFAYRPVRKLNVMSWDRPRLQAASTFPATISEARDLPAAGRLVVGGR